MFVAILAIVNFILARHEIRFDLSDSGTFSLSEQTETVLDNLEDTVKITAFFAAGSKVRSRAEDLFENYSQQSEKISYVLIDPDKKPVAAKRYGITEYDTVLLESRGRTSLARTITEEGLTSALVRISRETKKTYYFVEGHGEHSIDDTEQEGYAYLKDTLEKQGFIVKKLFLLNTDIVPKDADVVIIGGPKRSFAEEEKAIIKRYLDEGGQLFLLLDPVLDPRDETGLEPFFSQWGAKLENGIVLDPTSGRVSIPTLSPGGYLPHEITDRFNLATFFPVTRSVFFDVQSGFGFRYDPFLETNIDTWFTASIEGDLEVDANRDQRGPIQFGGVISSTESGEMRLVIIGDSDFAANGAVRSAGNGDLFLNVVSWLANEDDLVSIRPKEVPRATLVLSPNQTNTIFTVSVLILPLGIMGIGLYIWRGRRRL